MQAAPADASDCARLFIALWPDVQVRAALAACGERWQWTAGAARVRRERLHLTLHFLGEVPRTLLPRLRPALAVPFQPFTTTLSRAALWRGGVAVLEAEPVPAKMRQLYAALGEALRQLGLPVEDRPLRPHVTLARRAGASLPPPEPLRLRWPAQGYALVESRPQPEGGYVLLQRYPEPGAVEGRRPSVAGRSTNPEDPGNSR